jgi:hypothetical protein
VSSGVDIGIVILLSDDVHLDRSFCICLLERLLHGLVESLVPVHSIWTNQLRILNSVGGVEIVFELLVIS